MSYFHVSFMVCMCVRVRARVPVCVTERKTEGGIERGVRARVSMRVSVYACVRARVHTHTHEHTHTHACAHISDTGSHARTYLHKTQRGGGGKKQNRFATQRIITHAVYPNSNSVTPCAVERVRERELCITYGLHNLLVKQLHISLPLMAQLF